MYSKGGSVVAKKPKKKDRKLFRGGRRCNGLLRGPAVLVLVPEPVVVVDPINAMVYLMANYSHNGQVKEQVCTER